MARPSLQASQPGIHSAKQALTKRGILQKDLVQQLGCSRHPISRFFTGKPVEQEIFINICDELGLDWLHIADLSELAKPPQNEQRQEESTSIDKLVQEVCSKIKDNIQERCGTMRVLDMSQPIDLGEIYTKVNILEKITGRKRKKLKELLQELHLEDFENFGFAQVTEERVCGLEAVKKYQKLIVLGKPGAGKTTFLKYIAIQSNQGHFLPNLVPIFVSLRDFVETPDEPNLLEYIGQQFSECGVTSAEIHEVLSHKAALVLLDGLDEVKQEHYQRVLREIRELCGKFYDNHFIMTCRIAACEYTFDKFTEVELADFDKEQISIFATNWFRNKSAKASDFIKRLENNQRIQELAVNPLLLTLLCLVFEESGDLPANRSELYKEGLEVFLKKWDAKRGIQRDQVYKQLSPQRKKDLLSKIALTTFEQGNYLFHQREVENYIAEYICDLPNAETDPEALQLDSEAVLRSIETQHGLLVERAKSIYSFSHLTFHEYFTAREIVLRSHPLEQALQRLIQHIHEIRWREVFLLATEMSQPNASMLLQVMKQKVDDLLVGNKKLENFLKHVAEISTAQQLPIKPAAVRAFYFDIDFEIDVERSLSLLLDRSANLLVCASFFTRVFQDTDFSKAIDLVLDYDRRTLDPTQKIINAASANEVMYLAVKLAIDSKRLEPILRNKLERIYQKDFRQAQAEELDEEKVKHLADEARNVAKNHHHLGGKDWQFTTEEKELLKQYYYANKLLVECLNSDCPVNSQVRSEILNTLLLPSH
ncbi:NACHT domain-containing protein [Scytonema sp. PCC 10023]|uniref:NACHT domain-containing protein n=1 Tax=Scytonema sp. PCC 10023 TaxID=1680591 RepID=UPI0039C6F0D7